MGLIEIGTAWLDEWIQDQSEWMDAVLRTPSPSSPPDVPIKVFKTGTDHHNREVDKGTILANETCFAIRYADLEPKLLLPGQQIIYADILDAEKTGSYEVDPKARPWYELSALMWAVRTIRSADDVTQAEAQAIIREAWNQATT